MIKKLLRSLGIKEKRLPDLDRERRSKIINHYNINKVLDVGANSGFYALKMRDFQYYHKIISFEPLNDAYEKLKEVSAKDSNWTTFNYALGNADMKSTINVAGNSLSSSILNMLPLHVESAPESEFVSKQEIEIKKLDTIFSEIYEDGDRIMLKIDTQGYEKNVLDGSEESLKKIRILQLEMSLAPLYENELIMVDMITYLTEKGFELISLENGFYDEPTGRLLQVDGIFVNKNIVLPSN